MRRHGRVAGLVARVATDSATSTLGLAVVSAEGGVPLGDLDEAAGRIVQAEPAWEQFTGFWQDPPEGAELIPARGCSVPTFHGSAADLAAVSATLLNMIVSHLATNTSGVHLVRLPHGHNSAGDAHVFIPHGGPWRPGCPRT